MMFLQASHLSLHHVVGQSLHWWAQTRPPRSSSNQAPAWEAGGNLGVDGTSWQSVASGQLVASPPKAMAPSFDAGDQGTDSGHSVAVDLRGLTSHRVVGSAPPRTMAKRGGQDRENQGNAYTCDMDLEGPPRHLHWATVFHQQSWQSICPAAVVAYPSMATSDVHSLRPSETLWRTYKLTILW